MKKIFLLLALVIIIFVGFKLWSNFGAIWKANAPLKQNISEIISGSQKPTVPGVNKTEFPLSIPAGHSISIYASNLGAPRDLVFDPTGTILTSITSQGKIVAVVDGQNKTILEDLDRPHGLAFEGNKLFVAEETQVSTFDYDSVSKKVSNKNKIIDLPGGGRHFTRSLVVKDDKLYISIGSSCDACVEKDNRYASVWVSNLDGSDFKSFAQGLRNSVFIALHPKTKEIWGTEMGRDFLGDNNPPEEVNIIKEGNFYGWPYCWGENNIDAQINSGGSKFDCSKSIVPHLKFQAHSAPLGLDFLGNDLLVSYHGSWNRTSATGYKVVKFNLDANGNLISGPEDFISGWLTSGNEVLGRPVDILVKGKEVYISDDKAGVIYLLSPF